MSGRSMQRVVMCGISLFAVLLVLVPVHAQDATPEADPTPRTVGFVYDYFALPAYPTGALLVVVVDRPASDIAVMQLTVESAQTLTLQPEELQVFSDNTFSVFHYVWDEPVRDPVAQFSDVAYEWQVVLGDGQNVSVNDTFTYVDPRAIWETQEDPVNRLDILMPEGGREISFDEDGELIVDLEVSEIWQTLNPILDLLEQETGPFPAATIAPFYADRRPLNYCADPAFPGLPVDERINEQIPCDGSTVEASFLAADILPLEFESASIIDLQAPLLAFVINRAYVPLWEGATVPEWFAFGIRDFYNPIGKNRYQETVRAAQRLNQLYTLPEMESSEDVRDPALWQAQSYSMLLYVAQQYGVPAVFELARELNADEPFAETYERVTGGTLAALLPNLQNWVFTSRAEADFAYIPYLETTPSPTPQNSPTPFPPTSTPTPTATATNTPTATVTGFLSATPLPTLTATTTATRAPATITPRPAGSLPDPTALPGTQDANNEPDDNLPLLVGVGIIFVLFFIATAILIQRSSRRY